VDNQLATLAAKYVIATGVVLHSQKRIVW